MASQKPKANSKGTPCDNKIVVYKLEHRQIELLQETIKNKQVNGQGIVIYDAKDFTDIVSNTYFTAFLNFSQVKAEEKEIFLDYLKKYTEKTKEEIKIKKFGLNIPLTYILNADENDFKKQPYLYVDSSILDYKERLRLTLLQKIKDAEGKGRKEGTGGISPRMVRVMAMYRYLLSYGWISKEKCDNICKILRYELISDRSFHRDINLIRFIEHIYHEDIIFDEKTKRYILKNYDKISG